MDYTFRYNPGDVVRVVDSWNDAGGSGRLNTVQAMNRFLGKEVTIADRCYNHWEFPAYYIEEDGGECYFCEPALVEVSLEEVDMAQFDEIIGGQNG